MKKITIKNRKIQYIILSVVIISVLSLTIAYAVLSTTLNISGASTISASDWSFKIEKFDVWANLDEEGKYLCSTGIYNCGDYYISMYDGKIEQDPTISGTSINNFSFSLTKPNDYVELFFTITNTGTIPAKLDAINIKEPQFTSPSNNQNDIEWAQNNIVYFDIIDDIINSDEESELAIGEILCPGETKGIIILGAMENTNSLPSDKVIISNLGTEYIFVQADKSACS